MGVKSDEVVGAWALRVKVLRERLAEGKRNIFRDSSLHSLGWPCLV